MRVWTKVTAFLPSAPEDWSAWSFVFERNDLLGTLQTDDPPTMSAYLAPGQESGLEKLKSDLMEFGATKVEIEEVPEENWSESWKQFFKPRRIGGRFLIRPTWEEYEAEPGDLEIVLDPGQAFGTGDHPTTRGCLELLEAEELCGKTVADIGCGSGILSIAAAMLGATEVIGVDTDPISVEASIENAKRNRVEVEARVGKGFSVLDQGSTYDVVVSNIISAALIGIAPDAAAFVKPGGSWIVSGIIEANWADVQDAAEQVGFILDQKKQEGEWVSAKFSR